MTRQASQDAKNRVAAPYVLISEDNRIAGYYTLSSTSIRIDDIPPELTRKLPQYPAIGATLIGRLARDISFRGQGIGELLLIDALKVSLAMSRKIAAVAVVVNAQDETAARFYRDFGFTPLPEMPNKLFLRMEAIDQLFKERAGDI